MIERILSRLNMVRSTGTSRWIACCPAHHDKTPSLAVRVTEDERILLHCFADCEIQDILDAIGITFDELFPKRMPEHQYGRVRQSFNAMDVLRCIAFEAHVAATASANLAQGIQLTEKDRMRLLQAATRLHRAVEVAEYA